MSQLLFLSPVLWGMVFGLFFFGGLWLTVIGLSRTSSALALRFVVSFLLRFLVLIFGLFWVANGQWFQSAFFLIGLLTMRAIWIFRVGLRCQSNIEPAFEDARDSAGLAPKDY